MAKVKVYNTKKQEVGEIDLSDAVFGVEPKRHLLHLVVRKQLAARRAGAHGRQPPLNERADSVQAVGHIRGLNAGVHRKGSYA